jgi:deazaflavin-dependent oxidoreductase (nitroreductase family)
MRLAPAILMLERAVRRSTGDRRGLLDLAGLPSLRLTATGRKTGLPRTVSLLYVPAGANYLLVGSNWGRPRHPSWSTNLLHADKAELSLDGNRLPATVHQLTGADRDAAWRRAVTFWPGYLMEQRLAGDREFRLFELRPLPISP